MPIAAPTTAAVNVSVARVVVSAQAGLAAKHILADQVNRAIVAAVRRWGAEVAASPTMDVSSVALVRHLEAEMAMLGRSIADDR